MSEITWLSGISGNWTNPSDWAGGVVPGPFDDAEIDAGGVYTVTISSAAAANSLTLDAAGATIAIGSGGALSVGTTLSLEAGTLNLYSGGLIEGGTLSAGSGAFLANGGTIDGATIEGALNVTIGSSGLTVGPHGLTAEGVNGTGPGTVNVIGAGGRLLLTGSIYMGGGNINVSGSGAGISLGGTSLDNATVNLGDGTGIYLRTATLGRHLTIDQQGAIATLSFDSAIEDGVINATASGGQFDIVGESFKEAGIVNVANGDTLSMVQIKYFMNLSHGQLNKGVFDVAGAGSTLVLPGVVRTDAATIILSGVGSTIEANGQALEASLGLIAPTGSLELLDGRNWSSRGAITNEGTLELGGVTFAASGLTNAGTITGAGDLTTRVSNEGSMIVQAGDMLSLVGGTLTNLVGGKLTGGGFQIGDGGLLQLPDDTLIVTLDATVVLDGSGSVQGYDTSTGNEVGLKNSLATIGGAGVLEILGSRVFGAANAVGNAGILQLGGAKFTGGQLTDAAGSKLTGFGVVASVFIDNGAVNSSGGALAFTAAGDVFKGVLGGQKIDFTGGSDLLTTNSSLTAVTVALSGGVVVTVGTALSFAQTLNETSATLTLAGKNLTLSGTARLGAKAVVNGTGELEIAAGGEVIGSASAGTAVIGVTIVDNGLIEAAVGTLDLTQLIVGAGAMNIDAGATLEVDGATAVNLFTTFAGSGATLSLGTVARFDSLITGFAGGDVIELIKTAATAATLEGNDKLRITNGSQAVATLKLSGSYVGDTFAVTMDQAGDAKITVSGGKGADAPPHAPGANLFSQQMAALGAGAGLSIQPGSNEIGRTWTLGLTRPVTA